MAKNKKPKKPTNTSIALTALGLLGAPVGIMLTATEVTVHKASETTPVPSQVEVAQATRLIKAETQTIINKSKYEEALATVQDSELQLAAQTNFPLESIERVKQLKEQRGEVLQSIDDLSAAFMQRALVTRDLPEKAYQNAFAELPKEDYKILPLAIRTMAFGKTGGDIDTVEFRDECSVNLSAKNLDEATITKAVSCMADASDNHHGVRIFSLFGLGLLSFGGTLFAAGQFDKRNERIFTAIRRAEEEEKKAAQQTPQSAAAEKPKPVKAVTLR